MNNVLAIALVAAMGWRVELATADDERAVPILARGAWTHLPTHSSAGIGTDREHHHWVIRSAEELARRAGSTARITVPRALGVKGIDFAKQMLIAIEDGTQPLVGVSGGGPPSALYAVEVHRIDRDDAAKTMKVHYRLVPRGKDQGVLTRPLEAVLVEKFDGKVLFDKLPPADKPGQVPAVSGKEVKPLARGFWADGWKPEAPRQEWIIRNYADLIDPRLRAPEPVLERMRAEAAARYARALGVKSIDFTRQMVVGVSGGVQPAGARVEITKVTSDTKGELIVIWKLHRPKAGSSTGEIAHVAEVILLDRITGAVKFQQDGEGKRQ